MAHFCIPRIFLQYGYLAKRNHIKCISNRENEYLSFSFLCIYARRHYQDLRLDINVRKVNIFMTSESFYSQKLLLFVCRFLKLSDGLIRSVFTQIVVQNYVNRDCNFQNEEQIYFAKKRYHYHDHYHLQLQLSGATI